MNFISKKLSQSLITLMIVIVLVTFLVSIPNDFNFTFSSFSALFKDVGQNLIDVKDSLLGIKTFNGSLIQGMILKSFIRSYKLVFTALLISIFVGIMKGVLDFNIKKQDTSLYRLLHTLFMLSIPDILIIIIFRISIKYIEKNFGITLLPMVGYKNAINIILPAVTLSIVPIVYVARSTTASLTQIYKQPFMMVAMSKGLSPGFILFKHGIRNCFNIFFDTSISAFNLIMSSLLIVEMFYYYPGVAIQMYHFSRTEHDFIFIVYALLIGLIYVFFDLTMNLAKIYFDPERRGELSASH